MGGTARRRRGWSSGAEPAGKPQALGTGRTDHGRRGEAHYPLSRNLLAGGFGGMCLVFAGHPLDTVKVRGGWGARAGWREEALPSRARKAGSLRRLVRDRSGALESFREKSGESPLDPAFGCGGNCSCAPLDGAEREASNRPPKTLDFKKFSVRQPFSHLAPLLWGW